MLKFFGGGSGSKKSTGPSKDEVRQMVNRLKREARGMDREIAQIDRKEQEIKVEIKRTVKQGHPEAAKSLAKNVVLARKSKSRMYTAKAQMESVALQVKQSASAARLASGMQQSTEVMNAMQSLISVPETSKIAQDLSKEMMKMGIIEEMMDDVLDDVVGITPEEEDLADEEVQKVLSELTDGILDKAPEAPVSEVVSEPVPALAQDPEEDAEMRQRLEALRS